MESSYKNQIKKIVKPVTWQPVGIRAEKVVNYYFGYANVKLNARPHGGASLTLPGRGAQDNRMPPAAAVVPPSSGPVWAVARAQKPIKCIQNQVKALIKSSIKKIYIQNQVKKKTTFLPEFTT